MKARADACFGSGCYTYLCLAPNNGDIRTLILKTFPHVHFISGEENAEDEKALPGNIAYSQRSLACLAGGEALFASCGLQEKLEKVFSCMELAINRVPDCCHTVFV